MQIRPGSARKPSRLIGTSVSHYLLLERLAPGARGGAVYKARDTELERLVALKLLPAGCSGSEEDRRRLAGEAQAVSVLEHPNICPVYEVGEVGDGRLFVAMAYCEGESLGEKVARGPIKIEVAVDLAAQVAAGLARAHERGILHRNLKPSNVLVTPDGQARIVDFGMASLDERTRVTGEETPSEVFARLSPEQLRGDPADPRSDVWAVGVLLYEMLAGRLPYPEGSLGAAAEPPPVSAWRAEVPPELERIVGRAMARRAAERYPRMEELRTALRAFRTGQARPLSAQRTVTAAAPRQVGHYRVGEVLGGGGMGVVHRAEDVRLGRTVALKFLPAELTRDPVAKARFLQEARAASALDHPNLCTVYDVGETDDHQLYLAMPCYDGETLRSRLERGPLPVDEAVDYALQAARGLAKAHRQGIVHRDVKPANLILTGDGVVKILDFGIAKLAGEAGLTRTGGTVGTPAYMSPEQIRGQEVDGRADLWSLGVVLFEMLTGRRPFQSDHDAALQQAVLSEAPEPLSRLRPEIPPELEAVVRRLLAKAPAQRYETADALAADLRLLAGTTSGFLPTHGSELVPIRRRALPLWAAGAVLLVALAALGGYLLRPGKGSPGGAAGAASLQATFTRLTELEGSETFPSLSPDGSYFAYVKASGGSADIYLQRVGGGNPINLTPDTPWDDTQPAYSPDGRQIAFRSERDGGGIFIMGATGESVRRLTDFGYNPAWSPDGRQIAVATESTATSPWLRSSRSQIWRVDAATGERRLVVATDGVQPSWSPNGRRIAYWGTVPGSAGRAVWTIEAGGRNPVAVTGDSFLSWNPVWSPAGDWLYFVSDRGGSMNLWRVPVDEASGRVLGELQPVTAPSAWSSSLSLSRDGRRILYATMDSRIELERAAFDPQAGRISGRPVPVTGENKAFRFIDASPDGQWLAFDVSVPQEDIFLVRTDGAGLRRLTDDSHKDRIPRWSPDSSRVLFYSNRSGRFEAWSVRVDGSGLEQLTRTTGPVPINPIWSPDGRRLACGIGTRNEAALVDLSQPLEERRPRLLPPVAEGLTFAVGAWSPDGRWLAGRAHSARDSLQGMYLYSLADGRYEKLTDIGGVFGWLPDQRTILGLDEDRGELLLVDRWTRAIRRIPPPPSSLFVGVAASPDGRSLYTLRSTEAGDIWMLQME